MEECTHNCSTCGSTCSSREEAEQKPQLNQISKVKHVIGIVSGKGGVGKSLVSSLLAAESQRRGFRTAIMDADLTGPSIPQAFGLHEKIRAVTDERFEAGGYMIPAKTESGIQVLSVNLLLPKETDPVIWRGAVIASTITQFWTDVFWEDVDYMFVDMPPGTGDAPLTVMGSLPIDGIVIVSTPQDLVSMIVEKAINMAKTMNVPVLGIVQNMSYFYCPTCGDKHPIFGESHIKEIAEAAGIPNVLELPMAPGIAPRVDNGLVEEIELPGVAEFFDNVVSYNK